MEPTTPAPDPIEISTIKQGGEDGLRVLVAYVEGGGLVGRRERDSKIPDRSNFG